MEGLSTEERVLRHLQSKERHRTGLTHQVQKRLHAITRDQQPTMLHATTPTVTLDVGGHKFRTTARTLCSVKSSRLCQLLRRAESQATGAKPVFIDRNGKAFAFVLEYLRSFAAREADFTLPPAHMAAAVLAEANYFGLSGLANILQQSEGQELVKTAQSYDAKLTSCGSAPVKFAAVQAAATSNKPQFTQAELQNLSQQLNQQIQVYTKQGFQIKDISSGMTPGSGAEGKKHILYVTVLLSARTQAVHDTAKLDLLRSMSGSAYQQVLLRSNSSFSNTNSESSFTGLGQTATGSLNSSPSDTLSGLRQRLLQHTSMAPSAASAEHQPTTPCVLPDTAQPSASSSNFSLASQDQMPMLTPRLVSCPQQAGSGAVMSAVETDSGSLPARGHVSEHDQNAAQQQPAPADSISSPVLLRISPSMLEGAATSGHPNELPDAASRDEEEGSVQEHSGPAILIQNDLYQQLPGGSTAAQQSDLWQANDIFETQTSIAEWNSTAKVLSAPSDQYSSLLISCTSSSSGHSSCWLPESACFMQSGTSERTEESHGPDVDQSSPTMPGPASQQPSSQQQQVFNELFDTQLSDILMTHEHVFGSLAERPGLDAPEPTSVHSLTGEHLQQAQRTVSLCSSQISTAEPGWEPEPVYRSSSDIDSASDSIQITMRSTTSGQGCVDSAQPSIRKLSTAASAGTTASIVASAPAETAGSPLESSAAAPYMKHQEQEPLTAAVSTAQLEVMGWDMFADTLGTFRLLSDTDSDAESTVTLLPEPCELGPITPEVAEHCQSKLGHSRYTEGAPGPVILCSTGTSACCDACQGLDQAPFDLVQSNLLTMPTETCLMNDQLSCLEQEYQSMMADRQGLVDTYPGMSSDAEEFDGSGTGCCGQYTSCAGAVEQCVTCNPCATCACYPYAALRPGKRHQKSRLKRAWAKLCRTGAAATCLRPTFAHERYTLARSKTETYLK